MFYAIVESRMEILGLWKSLDTHVIQGFKRQLLLIDPVPKITTLGFQWFLQTGNRHLGFQNDGRLRLSPCTHRSCFKNTHFAQISNDGVRLRFSSFLLVPLKRTTDKPLLFANLLENKRKGFFFAFNSFSLKIQPKALSFYAPIPSQGREKRFRCNLIINIT